MYGVLGLGLGVAFLIGVGYLTTSREELENVLDYEQLLSSESEEEGEEGVSDSEDGVLEDEETGPRHLTRREMKKRFNNLHHLPDGFRWYMNKAFYLAVPVPRGWSPAEDENTFAIRKGYDFNTRTYKAGPPVPGEIVLTVSCMASQPKEFALTFLNNFPAQLKQAQKIITSQWKKSRINEWLTKHEMEFEDPGQRGATPPILVKNLLVINDKTNSVYLIMFEAKKSHFEMAWKKYGQVMIENMDFYKFY